MRQGALERVGLCFVGVPGGQGEAVACPWAVKGLEGPQVSEFPASRGPTRAGAWILLVHSSLGCRRAIPQRAEGSATSQSSRTPRPCCWLRYSLSGFIRDKLLHFSEPQLLHL